MGVEAMQWMCQRKRRAFPRIAHLTTSHADVESDRRSASLAVSLRSGSLRVAIASQASLQSRQEVTTGRLLSRALWHLTCLDGARCRSTARKPLIFKGSTHSWR